MATRESRLERGRRRGRFLISRSLGDVRTARVNLGISQTTMARELQLSQAAYSCIEADKAELSVMRLAEIASVLGMEISVNLHPIGDPVRDRGQQALIKRFRGSLRRRGA